LEEKYVVGITVSACLEQTQWQWQWQWKWAVATLRVGIDAAKMAVLYSA